MEKQGGIYQIRNIITNKCYVGSTINFRIRWNRHKNYLKKGIHPNKHLQGAWNLYNENSFKFEYLEIIENINKEKIENRENYYFDLLKPEYNICMKAYTKLGTPAWNKGIPLPKEQIEKRTLSVKGKYVGKNSPFYGREVLESTKIKISNTLKEKYKNGLISKPMLGKYHTEESLKKMSIAHTGKKCTSRKLTNQQIMEIRDMIKNKIKCKEIAILFNVNYSTIDNIKKERFYKDI